jgi:hypothetical protein
MSFLSQTWLVPFIYLAVVLGVYLFAPEANRAKTQQRMRADINFFLICDILLIPLAIGATLDWRHRYIDYIAWILLIGLLVISIRRALSEPPPVEPDEPPPL